MPCTTWNALACVEHQIKSSAKTNARVAVSHPQLLEDIDANKLPLFSNLPAPAMAKSYWKLGDDAMFRDLVLAVR